MDFKFSEDEQSDFLLARGYIICVRVEEYEYNIYQNRFVSGTRVVVEAIKDNKVESLEAAFYREFKQRLIIY